MMAARKALASIKDTNNRHTAFTGAATPDAVPETQSSTVRDNKASLAYKA